MYEKEFKDIKAKRVVLKTLHDEKILSTKAYEESLKTLDNIETKLRVHTTYNFENLLTIIGSPEISREAISDYAKVLGEKFRDIIEKSQDELEGLKNELNKAYKEIEELQERLEEYNSEDDYEECQCFLCTGRSELDEEENDDEDDDNVEKEFMDEAVKEEIKNRLEAIVKDFQKRLFTDDAPKVKMFLLK